MGGLEVDVEYEADRDARVWGEMDKTGVLGIVLDEEESRIKSRTSLCDCIVMRIDSAEVTQPLYTLSC
jgi:hypothetical protein